MHGWYYFHIIFHVLAAWHLCVMNDWVTLPSARPRFRFVVVDQFGTQHPSVRSSSALLEYRVIFASLETSSALT
jgi:hypothetical protein